MKFINLIIIFFPIVALFAACALVNHHLSHGDIKFWVSGSSLSRELPDFYAKNLRGSLFAGFLTLGGFLMSLKAFIIVNMKKEVFESDAYKKAWDEAKKTGIKPYSTKFSPLRDLSGVIFLAVATCIGSATSQLTIGLFSNQWASIFSIAFSSIAICFVLRTLWLIRRNLRVLFDYLDETDDAETATGSQTN